MDEDKPVPPNDRPAMHPAFTVIPGGGPARQGHLVRLSDGFVCLRLDPAEPSRARLRLVDESYEPDSVAEEPSKGHQF
jgi:hypothetical protein